MQSYSKGLATITGYKLDIKGSIEGGVEHIPTTIEDWHITPEGTRVKVAQTKTVILHPNLHDAAVKVLEQVRTMLKSECSRVRGMDFCHKDKFDAILRPLIDEAYERVKEFNDGIEPKVFCIIFEVSFILMTLNEADVRLDTSTVESLLAEAKEHVEDVDAEKAGPVAEKLFKRAKKIVDAEAFRPLMAVVFAMRDWARLIRRGRPATRETELTRNAIDDAIKYFSPRPAE